MDPRLQWNMRMIEDSSKVQGARYKVQGARSTCNLQPATCIHWNISQLIIIYYFCTFKNNDYAY